MCKKLICLASLLFVVGLATNALAQHTDPCAYTWDSNSNVNYLWKTPGNWVYETGYPGEILGDSATIPGGLLGPNQPIISSDSDINIVGLSIVGSSSDPCLTIQAGGKLAVFPYPEDGTWPIVFLGSGWAPGHGKMIINGGNVTCRKFWVGYRDLGMLDVNDGNLIVSFPEGASGGYFEVARGDDCPCTTQGDPATCGTPQLGAGEVRLRKGTIQCDVFTLRKGHSVCGFGEWVIWPTQLGYIDIRQGTLIIGGNHNESTGAKVMGASVRDSILNHASDANGWIVMYDDEAAAGWASAEKACIVVDYGVRNAAKTTVTAYLAQPQEAYDLDPIPYSEDVNPKVTLTWKPGDYVGNDGKYLGAPSQQKGDGHHVFIDTHNINLKNDSAKTLLNYPVGTQYGHVWGTQDSNYYNAETNYPGGALKLATTYYWCVVEANDANGAAGDRAWKSAVWQFKTVGGKATNPNPGDKSTIGVAPSASLVIPLSWKAGYYAASTSGHQVYFGTDFNEVDGATTGYTTTTNPNMNSPAVLLSKDYYWRVDEVNALHPDLKWKGDTWKFSVGAYRSLDELNYNSDGELHAKWLDYMNDFYSPVCSQEKNGSMISNDKAAGAMTYDYDNNDRQDAYNIDLDLDLFSEIIYQYASPVSFSYGDAGTTLKALVIRLKGAATNDANAIYDRMYVGIEDSTGKRADVNHPDASAQQKAAFDEWNIDLNDFVKAKPGLNLGSISKVYLGFGRKCNPYNATPGGEGVVSFDYIRLYASRCVGKPGYRQLGDVSGDCTVDMADVGVFVDAWLMADRLTGNAVPVPDNDPCLLAWYKFEGNYNNDPNGRLGATANGTAYGTPSIVVDANRPLSSAGNQVLYTDQVGDVCDYVLCGTWANANGVGDGNFMGKSFTLMTWMNQAELSTETLGWAYMFGHGEGMQKIEFGFVPSLERNVHSAAHGGIVAVSATKLDLNRWYHVALAFEQAEDANGGTSRLYVDGHQSAMTTNLDMAYDGGNNPGYDPNWSIGCEQDEGNLTTLPYITRPFHGYLDDVRAYDRKLEEEEIMWIAGVTEKNYYPISAPYIYSDIHSPEALGQKSIQFKDFSVLADDWMESAVWP